MSWEIFRCEIDCETYPDSCINEALYKAQTDALVSGGYLDAGYNGIHIGAPRARACGGCLQRSAVLPAAGASPPRLFAGPSVAD